MSNFVVSARKYRPVRFEEVVGQQHVTQTLKNALRNDQLAHAFLFCGPRGVGKTTCARILAKVLNCTRVGEDFEPCDQCDSCRAFNANASFNITELDAASNNSVEHIRALIEQVRFQPQQGAYKVFIIDEVHMLSQAAFNAFLKTLEEPPPYAIFILATTEKHKILPTILSRCQIFDFKRIQVADIMEHLENICRDEQIQADRDALHIIAQKADGALRDALSIFDRVVSFSGGKVRYEAVIENLNVLDYDYYFRLVEALVQADSPEALLILDEILRKGFDGDLFINGLSEHLRNLLVCKDPETLRLLEVSEGLQDRYQKQAALVPHSFLLSALHLANQCDLHYKTARNKRLHVELSLLKMAHLQQLTAAEPAPEAPEKKSTEPAGRPESPAASPAESPKEDIEAEPCAETEAPRAEEPPGDPEPGLPPAEEPLAAGPKHTPHLSLDQLLNEVREEQAAQVESRNEDIDLEQVKASWKRYQEQLENATSRLAMQQAQLELEGLRVEVRVGTALAEQTIRQEKELPAFLKHDLRNQNLRLVVKVDKSLAPASASKKKPLTDMDKFRQMYERNPAIKTMQERFDLRFDQD